MVEKSLFILSQYRPHHQLLNMFKPDNTAATASLMLHGRNLATVGATPAAIAVATEGTGMESEGIKCEGI